MRYFWIFLLVCSTCFAETEGERILKTYGKPLNEKYSHQAYPYHNVSFKEVDPKEFNNTVIKGSCFYQEALENDPNFDIFPDGMTGVIFIGCNLDNINIPIGNEVVGCSQKRIKVQNDWDDWLMEYKDGKWKPKEPIDKEQRLDANLSIDPKDIPNEKWTEEQRKQFEDLLFSASIVP